MINLNGSEYGLCLVDTNAASEMAKNPTRELQNYLKWSVGSKPVMITCFSLFTILELRQKPAVYEQFIQTFSPLPCAVLKSHEQLLAEEVKSYPTPRSINPILLALLGFATTPENRLQSTLGAFFNSPEAIALEKGWLDGRDPAIAGMLSLVENYPPEQNKYTASEIRMFLEITVFEQLAMRFMPFAKAKVEAGHAIDIDAFLSLKMSLLTVFHKFYVDNRRPSQSDVFDIIISAPTPYLDAIITERHQAEVIRKIKRLDNFIENIKILTVNDLRSPHTQTQ